MNRSTKPLLALAAITLLTAGVSETKHNFSSPTHSPNAYFWGTRQVCVFCHTVHNGDQATAQLWNHEVDGAQPYDMYDSPTMDMNIALTPHNGSIICLSCHDGTIAVGALRSSKSPVSMMNVGARGEIPDNQRGHIGIDLSGMHPVSVRYQATSSMGKKGVRWPPLDAEGVVGPDANGFVQCTSCHDPHGSRSERYPFWRKTTFSAVCKVCHDY